MNVVSILNNIIKISFINICTFWILVKLIDFKETSFKKIIIICITSIIGEIISISLIKYFSVPLSMLMFYLIYGAIISKIIKKKIQYTVIVTFISLIITYFVFIISIFISGSIIKLINEDLNVDNVLILFLIMICECIIIKRIFKVRRLKNGVSFFKNETKLSLVFLIIIGIATILYSLVQTVNGRRINGYILAMLALEAICMIIWIKRKITACYKQKLKEQTVNELETELNEKNKELNKALEENQAIARINHKYSSRIRALERISKKIFEKPEIVEKMKNEFGEEFEDLKKQIDILSEDFSNEMSSNIKHTNILDKTGVFGIDNILEFMNEEASRAKIDLELKINGDINYMVQNIISENKLETLIGDHVKDAIIAINSCNNSLRKILVIIGLINDCYELKIYDTGIEFEIETLLKLGKTQITTHKDTGGSGIGFITTFETLKELNASLIIEEKHEMKNTDYTKSVSIKFDGKNEYRIKSYRNEIIEELDEEKRIIIQK